MQVELVERGSAPERDLFLEMLVGKEFDNAPADNQILFDLSVRHPGRGGPPFDNMGSWNQRSLKTSVLTMTFHTGSRENPLRGRDGSSGVSRARCFLIQSAIG